MPVPSVRPLCMYASPYSWAWSETNRNPSRKVSARNTLSTPRLPAFSAWWAIVTVTPEVSRIAVLSAGTPKAGMTSKVPSARGPSFAGPLVGQAAS